jgi:L-amino acid N-acyltransferase YncA
VTRTIRRATDADWAQIWPIWHAIVAAGETYTWDPATSEAQARQIWMLPEPAEVWVAEQPDTAGARIIEGTALLKPNQPGLGAHIANAGFMVSGAAAGKGIGRALAERIVDRARELGYRGMQFNAVVSSNTRAVGLWKSLGFEIVGTVPAAFRHARLGYVDLHIMYRQL